MDIVGKLIGYKVYNSKAGNPCLQGWIKADWSKDSNNSLRDMVGTSLTTTTGDQVIPFGAFKGDFARCYDSLKSFKPGDNVKIVGQLINFNLSALFIEKA